MATLASMIVHLGIDSDRLRAGAQSASNAVRNMGNSMRNDNNLAMRGLVRDTEGRLWDMQGRLVRSGHSGGRNFARSMVTSIGRGLASAGSAMTSGIGSALRAAQGALGSHPAVAGIGLAIAAGIVATLAPFIAAALSGMVISVVGLGFIGLGAMVLKDEPAVKAAASKLKNTISTTLKSAAQPLVPEFVKSLDKIKGMFKGLENEFAGIFGAMSLNMPGLTSGITDAIKAVVSGIEDMLNGSKPAFDGFASMIRKIGEGLGEFFRIIGENPKEAGAALSDLGSIIKGILIGAAYFIAYLTQLYGQTKTVIGLIIGAFVWLYNVVTEKIPQMIKVVINWFAKLPGRVWAILAGWVAGVIAKATVLYHQFTSWVSRTVTKVVSWFRSLPGRARSALASLAAKVYVMVYNAGTRMLSAAKSGVSKVVSAVRALPGKAKSALGSIGSYLYSSGRALLQGFVKGIKSMVGAVAGAVKSAVSAAKKFFPNSPAKEGPFSGKGWTLHSGRALIDGFSKGVSDRMPALAKQMSSMPGLEADVPGMRHTRRAVDSSAPVTNNHTTNVYPQRANLSRSDLELLQRRQEASSRVGRPR